MRVLIKKSVELLLSKSGLPQLARIRRRGGTLILAYHNVVPQGDRATGDRSLHIPQREFARQLDIIQETHDVVPLSQLLDPVQGGKRPRVIFTFDDAYQGAVTAGVEELAARGLPATIFVTPAFVGGRSFWWDEIAAGRGGELPAATRQYAIEQLAGRDDAVRRWAATEQIPLGTVAWHERAATESQLHSAVAGSQVDLAAHSWSHANLARLNTVDLLFELARPLAWLRERFPRVLPWLSYPYGLRSTATEEYADTNGYAGGLLIEGGWTPGPEIENHFAIPRLNVPAGMTVNGLSLRAAGVLPIPAAANAVAQPR